MIPKHQETARAILAKGIAGAIDLRGREGQFLGGIAFDANPLTEKQKSWMALLAERHHVPFLADGGEA